MRRPPYNQPQMMRRLFPSCLPPTLLWQLIAAIVLLAGIYVRAASADALDEIHKRGTLNWGGDQEGGGPYVFPDPKDPNHLMGFEVELADSIGGRIGRKGQIPTGAMGRNAADAGQSDRRGAERIRTHPGADCAIIFARARTTPSDCN